MHNFLITRSTFEFKTLLRFVGVFLVVFLFTSCGSFGNSILFQRSLSKPTLVQLEKSAAYEVNDSLMLPEIDSVMQSVFYRKNIRLVTTKSRFILHLEKIKYTLHEFEKQQYDRNGQSNGFGMENEIYLNFQGYILDTLTKKSKKLPLETLDSKPQRSYIFNGSVSLDSSRVNLREPLKTNFLLFSHWVYGLLRNVSGNNSLLSSHSQIIQLFNYRLL